MATIRKIETIEDIRMLVDEFYGKVRKDQLIGPIFDERIADKWPEHLDKMYRFWQTILLGEHTYSGSPFAPHATMPVKKHHFNRWISLFYQTINENFEGEVAEEARWRAARMAEMFNMKIKFYRDNEINPLLS